MMGPVPRDEPNQMNNNDDENVKYLNEKYALGTKADDITDVAKYLDEKYALGAEAGDAKRCSAKYLGEKYAMDTPTESEGIDENEKKIKELEEKLARSEERNKMLQDSIRNLVSELPCGTRIDDWEFRDLYYEDDENTETAKVKVKEVYDGWVYSVSFDDFVKELSTLEEVRFPGTIY